MSESDSPDDLLDIVKYRWRYSCECPRLAGWDPHARCPSHLSEEHFFRLANNMDAPLCDDCVSLTLERRLQYLGLYTTSEYLRSLTANSSSVPISHAGLVEPAAALQDRGIREVPAGGVLARASSSRPLRQNRS